MWWWWTAVWVSWGVTRPYLPVLLRCKQKVSETDAPLILGTILFLIYYLFRYVLQTQSPSTPSGNFWEPRYAEKAWKTLGLERIWSNVRIGVRKIPGEKPCVVFVQSDRYRVRSFTSAIITSEKKHSSPSLGLNIGVRYMFRFFPKGPRRAVAGWVCVEAARLW